MVMPRHSLRPQACLRSVGAVVRKAGATEDEYLTHFDSLVQTQEVTGKVLSGLRGSLIPLHYPMSMIAIATFLSCPTTWLALLLVLQNLFLGRICWFGASACSSTG